MSFALLSILHPQRSRSGCTLWYSPVWLLSLRGAVGAILYLFLVNASAGPAQSLHAFWNSPLLNKTFPVLSRDPESFFRVPQQTAHGNYLGSVSKLQRLIQVCCNPRNSGSQRRVLGDMFSISGDGCLETLTERVLL